MAQISQSTQLCRHRVVGPLYILKIFILLFILQLTQGQRCSVTTGRYAMLPTLLACAARKLGEVRWFCDGNS